MFDGLMINQSITQKLSQFTTMIVDYRPVTIISFTYRAGRDDQYIEWSIALITIIYLQSIS